MRLYSSTFLFAALFLLFATSASANTGVIDTTADNQAKVCHNAACDDFGIINFEISSDLSIVVDSEQGITGRAWGNELGWIDFSPNNSGVEFVNTSTGVLTGYAWSQVSGWINFAPTGQGVTIDPDTGEFSGYAWSGGPYGGWIKFDCASSSTCVRTTWRGDNGVIGGGGPGGCTKNCDPVCESPFVLEGGQCVCPVPTVQIGLGCAYIDNFTDVCPNIEDFQTVIPTGMSLQNGQCVSATDGPGGGVTSTGNPTDPQGPTPTTPNNPNPGGPLGPGLTNGPGTGFITPLGVLGPILDAVGPVVGYLEKLGVELIGLLKTPMGTTVAQILSALGITVAALGAIFSNVLSLADLGLQLLRLWSLFLYGMGFRKRNRPWGTVYDSVTKQPLDPAYVVLIDEKGDEVATSITDLDGRYGFLVEPGNYRIKASKTNYTFPSEKLKGRTSDELYNDLYFGENLHITESSEVITKNIPLDQKNFDWNEFAKREQSKMRFYKARDLFIQRLSTILFYIGFAVSIVLLFVLPGPYNIIVFCLYLIFFIFRNVRLSRRRKGSVVYGPNNDPLSFGILRVRAVSTGQEIAHRVLDRTGNYYCIVPNGVYNVAVEKKNPDESYSLLYVSPPVEVKNGILRKSFKVY